MPEEDNFIDCECGARINGTSKLHAQGLMAAHLLSRRHKELMEIKNRKAQRKL